MLLHLVSGMPREFEPVLTLVQTVQLVLDVRWFSMRRPDSLSRVGCPLYPGAGSQAERERTPSSDFI